MMVEKKRCEPGEPHHWITVATTGTKANYSTCTFATPRTQCCNDPCHMHYQPFPSTNIQWHPVPLTFKISSPLILHPWQRLLHSHSSTAELLRDSSYSISLLPHLLSLSPPSLPSGLPLPHCAQTTLGKLCVTKFNVTLLFLNIQHYLAKSTILSLKYFVHVACSRPIFPGLPLSLILAPLLVPKCWCLSELYPGPSLLFLSTHIQWPHPLTWHWIV